MPTFVTSGGSGAAFVPCPQGTHQAVCVDVIDRGLMETAYGEKRKVDVRWQVSENMPDGKPFLVQKRYTASLNEKARLRQDLESWRGKPFSAEELAQFDLDNLLGVNCLVNVVHHEDDKGRTWANVMSIAPLLKGMTKMSVAGYVMERDKVKSPDYPNGTTAETDDSIPF